MGEQLTAEIPKVKITNTGWETCLECGGNPHSPNIGQLCVNERLALYPKCVCASPTVTTLPELFASDFLLMSWMEKFRERTGFEADIDRQVMLSILHARITQ